MFGKKRKIRSKEGRGDVADPGLVLAPVARCGRAAGATPGFVRGVQRYHLISRGVVLFDFTGEDREVRLTRPERGSRR